MKRTKEELALTELEGHDNPSQQIRQFWDTKGKAPVQIVALEPTSKHFLGD
ncbi:hypothetical protein MYX82_07705 [Acidobacteria bacterium AH-259-D05]|nr:hypothetical protein [Acidobacteria bacterium AH-259-D05]